MPDSGVDAGFCGPAGLARGRAMVRARAGRDTPPSPDGEAQFLHASGSGAEPRPLCPALSASALLKSQNHRFGRFWLALNYHNFVHVVTDAI